MDVLFIESYKQARYNYINLYICMHTNLYIVLVQATQQYTPTQLCSYSRLILLHHKRAYNN